MRWTLEERERKRIQWKYVENLFGTLCRIDHLSVSSTVFSPSIYHTVGVSTTAGQLHRVRESTGQWASCLLVPLISARTRISRAN